jgi:ABC-type transport system involved in cytochrome bd biosynthesis fused ATPase/permease subunit
MFAATLLAFWLQPLIGLLWLALTLILNFLIPVLTMKTLLEKAATIEKLESKYADQVRTSVHGALEAEIYGYLDEVISEVHKAESEILKAELKLVSRIRTFQFLINLLIGSGLIATVLYASNNQMPAVQVAMLVFLALTGFEANLAWYPNLFNSGKLKLAEQNLEAIPLYSVPKGEEVAFDKLSLHNFSGYWTNPTAKPLTFEIQRGEVLVLRGASGVGKSTTAMALAGLTDYQGSAQISGTEIRDISNLSDLISGALQNGHIFNTSLRENLKISGSENFEEILELLELKQLVSELPNGLDTIIGQYGSQASSACTSPIE